MVPQVKSFHLFSYLILSSFKHSMFFFPLLLFLLLLLLLLGIFCDVSFRQNINMSFKSFYLYLPKWIFNLLLLLGFLIPSLGLNPDGILLLSFKYSVLNDPLSVLQSWNSKDESPCSWNGVSCSGYHSPESPRVTGLVLPNSQLMGSLPLDLGKIQHLQLLDLSNNSFNGSLPTTLFYASELISLSLYNNLLSGEIPNILHGLKSVQLLDLSHNSLTGKIPENLTALRNLKYLSFSQNQIFGEIPNGFKTLQIFDLSSNLINGSLPEEFNGDSLRYLNFSNNKLSGPIPIEFAKSLLSNSTVDLSFNNLTGEIPDSPAFKPKLLSGNLYLCGEPLRNSCTIPSTISIFPNISSITSSAPAIAAIPKSLDSSVSPESQKQSKLTPETIAGIIVGDLVGIGVFCFISFYIFRFMKSKKKERTLDHTMTTTSSDSEDEDEVQRRDEEMVKQQKGGTLVMVDGETELELETLLKASAYILGATGSSIVYKAVLENGSEFAVRRIGETGLERYRDFKNRVRVIGKLRHPNLVRVRGYYWGSEEKLVIYDYVPNGSLANASYRKAGSSPYQLPWEVRVRIARGVARALTYLHEKKHVHGNLKPSNILLGPQMEPKVGDFGLERAVGGETDSKSNGSARFFFGSKRSSMSRETVQDLPIGASPSFGSSRVSPYLAPEALKNLKPNPRWDVYSFGIILLELLTGKVFTESELTQWNAGFVVEERNRVLRMADVGIRGDVEGREEMVLSCFRLGFGCASMVPQKRPNMKEVVQTLERIPSRS